MVSNIYMVTPTKGCQHLHGHPNKGLPCCRLLGLEARPKVRLEDGGGGERVHHRQRSMLVYGGPVWGIEMKNIAVIKMEYIIVNLEQDTVNCLLNNAGKINTSHVFTI